jgi:pSer/pThr/pTyr-binding forkhead associated (FHA) protein
LSGESLGRLFKLTQARHVIGRAENATVRLQDEGISIRHAELRQENGGFILEVLDRDAETYVNGEPVIRRELVNGDRLQLGTITTLKYTTQIPLMVSPSEVLEKEAVNGAYVTKDSDITENAHVAQAAPIGDTK